MNEDIMKNEVVNEVVEAVPEVLPRVDAAIDTVANAKPDVVNKVAKAGVVAFAVVGVVSTFRYLKRKFKKTEKKEEINVDDYVTTDDVEVEEEK